MVPSCMHLTTLIDEFLTELTGKGSRITDYLLPGLTLSEIQQAESSTGYPFPEELKIYLSRFGHGFRESERSADIAPMLDFHFLSYEMSMRLQKRYAATIVLGSDLFTSATRVFEFPLMTSGAEFISLVWSESVYAVVWKVNDYGFSSTIWPSLERLFEYVLDCWKSEAYWIKSAKDEVEGDYLHALQLLSKYGTRR